MMMRKYKMIVMKMRIEKLIFKKNNSSNNSSNIRHNKI